MKKDIGIFRCPKIIIQIWESTRKDRLKQRPGNPDRKGGQMNDKSQRVLSESRRQEI